MIPDYIKEENGKFIVRVIFGKYNVRKYENNNPIYKDDRDGMYVEKEYNSIEAAEAYLDGVADMDGWLDYYPLYNNEENPKFI